MTKKIVFHSIQPIGDNLPFKFEYKSNTGKKNIVIVNSKNIPLPKTRVPIHVNPCFFHELLLFSVIPLDNEVDNNFIAINKEGKVIWKFNEGNYLGVKHRFVHLLEGNKDELWVKNLAGQEYRIDHTTGKVIETRYENMDFDCQNDIVRIGNKEIALEIPEGDGGKVDINDFFSWRGELLFVLYNTNEPKRLNEHRFQYFEYIVAFNKKGEKLWQKSDIELRGGHLSMFTGISSTLRVATYDFVFDLDVHTGKIIKKTTN